MEVIKKITLLFYPDRENSKNAKNLEKLSKTLWQTLVMKMLLLLCRRQMFYIKKFVKRKDEKDDNISHGISEITQGTLGTFVFEKC